jgi:uncharacterized membrane protein
MDLLTQVIFILSILAFVISVITEVTKEIGFLARIPTSFQVIALSVFLTPIALIGFASYKGYTIAWYMVFGSILAGFIVAFLTMYGWDKLTEIWKRFKRGSKSLY